jgi:uncharacterized protein (DUF58 family)
VRAALAGLTVRGRCFAAAGLTAAVCAILLGQRDLLRVGVLLSALPLVSLAVANRTRYRLECTRRLEPPRVAAGQESRVVLRLSNDSRLPTGLMLVEDDLSYVLGSRPRFVIDRVEPRGRREVSYPVRSDVRGRFRLGPLSIRLTDPFGLVEVTRSFAARDYLTVTPVVRELPAVALGGEWSGSGESRNRSVAATGEDDVATREYRVGDDLRRVHWRSTARFGELMVRREEQPWQSRCSVLLDGRAAAHRGEGPASSYEWALSATASLGLHLVGRGYALRVVTDTGATLSSAGREGGHTTTDFAGLLLEALAVSAPSRTRDLTTAVDAVRRGGGDGLLVAVLGALSPTEAQDLARLRHAGIAAVALLLDTANWADLAGGQAGGPTGGPAGGPTGGPTGSQAGSQAGGRARGRSPRPAAAAASYAATASLLRSSGWRVVPVRAGNDLAALWPSAARGASPSELEPAGGAA